MSHEEPWLKDPLAPHDARLGHGDLDGSEELAPDDGGLVASAGIPQGLGLRWIH